MIEYIKFRDPVNAGNAGDISSWREKDHGKRIKVSERGPFLILEPVGENRRRVPMSNVVYIVESGEDVQGGGNGNKGKERG